MGGQSEVRVVAAELERDGKFLITQRRERAVFPLLWEFPSGRVEEGESDAVALKRELQERLGAEIEVGTCALELRHDYAHASIEFRVYQCQLLSNPDLLKPLRVRDWQWVPVHALGDYDFPPADAESIQLLLEREG